MEARTNTLETFVEAEIYLRSRRSHFTLVVADIACCIQDKCLPLPFLAWQGVQKYKKYMQNGEKEIKAGCLEMWPCPGGHFGCNTFA